MDIIPSWHKELQKELCQIMLVYCLNSKDLLPFLTATLCGQFVLANLSEEKVQETLDRMFNSYKEIKDIIDKEGR